MAIIGSSVALSHNVKESALNLNVKAYESRRTLAATWELSTRADATPPESAFSPNMVNDSNESVNGDDGRTIVDPIHFRPGGKYRCR